MNSDVQVNNPCQLREARAGKNSRPSELRRRNGTNRCRKVTATSFARNRPMIKCHCSFVLNPPSNRDDARLPSSTRRRHRRVLFFRPPILPSGAPVTEPATLKRNQTGERLPRLVA